MLIKYIRNVAIKAIKSSKNERKFIDFHVKYSLLAACCFFSAIADMLW